MSVEAFANLHACRHEALGLGSCIILLNNVMNIRKIQNIEAPN